ncbi:MAG: BlaI/MecI/CopY family transcriptional regulator [Planctomycetaceae bacterium]|nr:BlaI/MecI/CopY family transcriptional regulator [Planctomycetaceae bacterium]
MRKKPQLASLQLAIMRTLWQKGEATVADVRETLESEGRELAYTTVATMLAKMERKGQVAHRAEGKAFIYRPVLGQEQVSRSMVTDLAERLFSGDVTLMVSHLLDGCEISAAELTRLKALIRKKELEERNAR